MTYRVALTYHPDIGTFRGKRGAWRVAEAWPAHYPGQDEVYATDREVVLTAAHRYRKGTWVNPLKILKEYQSTKRSNTQ